MPLPDEIDDATAAAIMNPGVAAWLALSWRAELAEGETALIMGATGVSGQLAVQLARRMGAGRIIAAGRNSAVLARLTQLGADVTVQLGSEDDAAALAKAAGEGGIDVIVDYLWGEPTEAAIRAISRRGLTHVAPRVRLVEIGQSAGATLTLPAEVLRSSGLVISGSGAGTIPVEKVVSEIPTFMSIVASGGLQIEVEEIPLADVAAAWMRPNNGHRVVLRV
jgi:NADPH:quinone reductase-like Zn-dependent oxidoreductase